MMETISVCFLHISVANVNQLISDSNLSEVLKVSGILMPLEQFDTSSEK